MPEQTWTHASRVKRQPSQYNKAQRERGPVYPQRKADGDFEARSYMPHRNKLLITRHDTRAKAEKRLAGNPRHINHQIIDHSRDAELDAVAKFKARGKGKAKAHD